MAGSSARAPVPGGAAMRWVPDPNGMVQFQIDRRRELAAADGKPLPTVPPEMCRCGGYIMTDGRCTKCGTLTPGWKR